LDGFLRFSLKADVDGFFSLALKIGSSDLVICTSKSPQQFLGLGLKIKQASVYRLRHETDGGTTTWDTRRDLVACCAW
jgi:hypothetical protein